MSVIRKRESLIIFYCIILILVCWCFNSIFNKKYNEYKKYYENFNNSNKSSGGKRNQLIKKYKSHEILDPDEKSDADEICDPDSSDACDLD